MEFILSLSKQVVSFYSPNRCLLYTLQAGVGFFKFSMQFCKTLQAGLRFMLSMQMFGLHFPSRCWHYQIHPCFIEYHTLTLQAGCRFSVLMQMFDYTLQADVGFSISLIYFSYLFLLSMQMFSLHSQSKCWPFQKLGHILFLHAYNLLCTSPISRVEFYKMLN